MNDTAINLSIAQWLSQNSDHTYEPCFDGDTNVINCFFVDGDMDNDIQPFTKSLDVLHRIFIADFDYDQREQFGKALCLLNPFNGDVEELETDVAFVACATAQQCCFAIIEVMNIEMKS